MLYVVDRKLVYNEKDGKAVPVDVSATRNPLTGRITTHTIEEAGEPVDLPKAGTYDICTVSEVIARFSCAETPYRFPRDYKPGPAAEEPQDEPESVEDAPAPPIEIREATDGPSAKERSALKTRNELIAEAKALGIKGLKDANKETIQIKIDEALGK